MSVERVLIVVSPVTSERDEASKAKQAATVKSFRLFCQEATAPDMSLGGDESGTAPLFSARAKTLMQRLTDRFIDFVQIELRDVHFRYEDSLSSSRPFAFGLTLESLVAQVRHERAFATPLIPLRRM